MNGDTDLVHLRLDGEGLGLLRIFFVISFNAEGFGLLHTFFVISLDVDREKSWEAYLVSIGLTLRGPKTCFFKVDIKSLKEKAGIRKILDRSGVEGV